MGNKTNIQNYKLNGNAEESKSDESLFRIRLPEDMVDNSYDYRDKNFSLVNKVLETQISIDFSKSEDQLKQIKNHDFSSEFKTLQNLVDYIPMTEKRFYDAIDMQKNRYSDIFPFSDSRVVLGNHEFINASKINTPFKNAFIAAQGPLHQTIQDFWQMVWESNSRLILMMCEIIENNKNKCAKYWPEYSSTTTTNSLISFEENGLSVEITSENHIDNYLTQRIFIISKSNQNKKESKEIIQLHFRNWPDHGVPEIISAFEAFEKINKTLDDHFEAFKHLSPVVVHCSAGVGRTGTAIAIYNLHYVFKKFVLEEKKDKVDFSVFNVVRKLKEQRIYMVQTKSQYEMIYMYFEIFVKKKLLLKDC